MIKKKYNIGDEIKYKGELYHIFDVCGPCRVLWVIINNKKTMIPFSKL